MEVKMANQFEPAFKKLKPEEPGESKIKLNDLPDLPFELILAYLPLIDRFKLKAVSRRWYNVLSSFKVKRLCVFDPRVRSTSGTFPQNFICSRKFKSYFQTLGHSFLANLKHLHFCHFNVKQKHEIAFGRMVDSFSQLEQLDLFCVTGYNKSDQWVRIKFNLPMLNSIQFERLEEIRRITLITPRLRNVKLNLCCKILRLTILPNADSVEKFKTSDMRHIEFKELKNLKYFYNGFSSGLYADILLALKHLKEIYLVTSNNIRDLFEPGKSEHLKIFLHGLLLNGPNDPAIDLAEKRSGRVDFGYLAENQSRLSEGEIPFINYVSYSAGARVDPELAIRILKRFSDLEHINVFEPVQDVERFLNLLKNIDIDKLQITRDGQPQELYDRLPKHYLVNMRD